MNGSVKIGPEFFAGTFSEYSDAKWAYVREVLQNSIDARSSRILVDVRVENGNTVITTDDDGIGMDRYTLENKLLALGGTGKAFQNGAVGGFGRAKHLTMLCHLSYSVETREWLVQGSGAQYQLSQVEVPRTGTRLTTVWRGDVRDDLIQAFKKFAAYTQWPLGKLFLNGTLLTTNLYKGTRRREFAFGTVYTNRTFNNVAIVRMRGIPMHVRYIQFDGTVILELAGTSADVLTSNRDGLRYQYSEPFQNFLTSLVVNKRSALQDRTARYQRYRGPEITVTSVREQSVALTDVLMAANVAAKPTATPGLIASNLRMGGTVTVAERTDMNSLGAAISLGHQFILKNTVGIDVPTFYRPDSEMFGDYSLSLAKVWSKLMVELHKLFNVSATFSIGFVFDEDNEAESENSSSYGQVYYLNPTEVVKKRYKGEEKPVAFKKRFKLSKKHRLLAIALHEFCHLDSSNHDENFSSALTEKAGVVMANLSRFNHCFVK